MEIPGIHMAPLGRPFRWLAAGLDDLSRTWPISLAYGAVFAALGYFLVNYAWSWPHLALALTSGFLLLAPFLALGFYDLSRQLDEGGKLSLRHTFTCWRANAGSIGLYAALLLMLLIAWERVSAILVGLFLAGSIPTFENLFGQVLGSGENMTFVMAYAVFGLLFAGAVFALSVVSLPMMLDRKVDVATALVTSVWTVIRNPLVMELWAAIIVVLVAIGYMTSFFGLAVFFPLLGHATWHAYQDLVEH
jgi:uncharacterized membrane protein